MGSDYFGQMNAVTPRSLSGEMNGINDNSGKITTRELHLGAAEGTQQIGTENQFAQSAAALYPQLVNLQAQGNQAIRSQDVGDIASMGTATQNAINRINPNFKSSLDAMNGAAGQAMAGSPLLGQLNQSGTQAIQKAEGITTDPLMGQLNQSASEQLALGSGLSPQQVRDATQAARDAYASRGVAMSNPSIVAEAMNRDAYGQQLLQQREGYAQGVQNLGQQEAASNTAQQVQLGNYAQGVQAANLAQKGQGEQFLAANQQAQQGALTPALGILTQQTQVSPTSGAQMMAAAPNTMGAGAQMMNPLLSYGQDLYNTNFNAAWNTQAADASNMAAIHGAIIGAVGNMAGGAMKACWVARAVLGTEARARNGWLKWQLFRRWLLFRAPRWFCRLYLTYGERVAAWLENKPRLREALRPWFEARAEREAIALEEAEQEAADRADNFRCLVNLQ